MTEMNDKNRIKTTASNSVVGATAKQPYVDSHNQIIAESEEENRPKERNKGNIILIKEAAEQTPPSDPQTVEEVARLMERNEKGVLYQTIENCVTALLNDPMLKQSIRRNDLTCRIDLVKPVGWRRRGTTLTDTDVNQIRFYLEKNYGLTREKQIKSAIDIVSNEQSYHPVRERIENLSWDGEHRIAHVLNRYLGAEKSKYSEEVMKIVLLGLIERVFNPGCKFEYMMCLIGGQGAGKSSFCSALAMEEEWFTDDIKRLDDEHIYRKLQGHIVIEFAEMAPLMSAKNVEETKAFLSRRKDTYKIPYETHPEDRPRQCIFIGSSNRYEALPADRTGNRRFLPVLVDMRLAERHPLEDEQETKAYLSQCIAEAYQLWLAGERPLITAEMETHIKQMQDEFTPEDSTAVLVQAWLSRCGEDYVCTHSIYEGVFNREANAAKNWELREISDVMNSLPKGTWERMKCHRFPKFGQQRGWKRSNISTGKTEKGDGSLLSEGFEKMAENERSPFEED
jgi:predicted P-loop ATPase